MESKLKKYFPMLRTREEILRDIERSIGLTEEFYSWNSQQQEEFLDFCTGVKGVKLLYDAFFKEIMNPEIVPERLEEFLSLILKQKIKIMEVLPGDSARIGDESSLLIMDILVRLEDGTYCNIEVQKIGYAFPGERCACYSADLLLRQYKRVRGKQKKNFTYKDIKGVYTIVLLEKSTKEFHEFPDIYQHNFCQQSNTGLDMNLLQNFVFIPLDIFGEVMHNKDIRNRLDAWLTFFSADSPEKIIELITKYPDFKAMYEHVYYICLNVERVMDMFSEELRILDRNTVEYMVDQMQNTIDEQKKEIAKNQKKIDRQKTELKTKETELESKEKELELEKQENARLRALLASKEK